jgi:hypothetical protein
VFGLTATPCWLLLLLLCGAVSISAKDVSNLRKKTGAGMMDCKKALGECNGDADKAVEV